jgi:predicted nucleic acid-binding protein
VDPAAVVLDASAAVDLLLRAQSAPWIREILGRRDVRAPAHFHAEVLNAFGRRRAGEHTTAQVDVVVRALMTTPVVVTTDRRLSRATPLAVAPPE